MRHANLQPLVLPAARGENVSPASTNGFTAPIVVAQYGLQLSRQMSFERWLNIGISLSTLATSNAWCLGDWLIYGEEFYSGRYRAAIEQTSLDYQTLRNYAWVARRFKPSRRHPALSFGHHAEVAGLPQPEQDYWLRKAGEESWSRNFLRREVRASLRYRENIAPKDTIKSLGPDGDREGDPDLGVLPGVNRNTPQSNPLQLSISISPEKVRTYHAMAVACKVSLEEWVLQVLEQAVCDAASLRSLAHPLKG